MQRIIWSTQTGLCCMEFIYNLDFSWQDGRYARNWTVTVLLQIQSVNSKRLWEKGVKWHQCFRRLTLPRHGGLFTTRGITEKTIVGSHLGDDLLRFVKPLERNKSIGCTIKKKTVYTKHTCRWFFVPVFCFTRSFTVDIPTVPTVFTNCSPSTHFLLLTTWPTYFLPASRFGAKKETEWPPKGSKQRNRQFFLHPQGCCIVGEDILLTVLSPRSFSLTLLRQMWKVTSYGYFVGNRQFGTWRQYKKGKIWLDLTRFKTKWMSKSSGFVCKFWGVLARLPTWPNSIAVREKHRSFDGIKQTDTNSIKPPGSELRRAIA